MFGDRHVNFYVILTHFWLFLKYLGHFDQFNYQISAKIGLISFH